MRELRMHPQDRDELHEALQQAIELEHSTIPPYLCAYFSIEDKRSEAARLIRSVVLDEMLHMALAANILNAVGGDPVVDRAGFVPTYPGHLPAENVWPDLMVHLRRFSKEQVGVFAQIEEPEEPIVIAAAAARPTIGAFYDGIADAIRDLGNGGFDRKDKRRRQLAADFPTRGALFPVTSVATALRAVEDIKEQGEGTTQHPTVGPDPDGPLAHYYRFREIEEGRRIRWRPRPGNPEEREWYFSDEEIPMPPVFPMLDDPATDRLPAGSRAAKLSGIFNLAYRHLLVTLHRTFTGSPGLLDGAAGIMYELTVVADQLLREPSGAGDGTAAGPSFEYVPTG